MKIRFTLADKISITIIAVGVFGIVLVYYISTSYRNFAYIHHADSIQQVAYQEVNDLVEDLKIDSLDLALAIEVDSEFVNNFQQGRKDKLSQQLDNQFYQYFVTAGIIRLQVINVYDSTFNLYNTTSKEAALYTDEIVCPHQVHAAKARIDSEKLKALSSICLHEGNPVFALMLPFGGLKTVGYLQIVSDLAYKLQKIEQSLAMPIQIKLLDGQVVYQSEDWKSIPDNRNYLNIDLPITDANNSPVITITLKSDMRAFNKEMTEHRNRIMSLSLIATALTVFIVLVILRRSTIPPLAKIHGVLEKIHIYSYTNNEQGRLLFEQLLEQIIQLRKKLKSRFAVMVLDLTHFKQINDEYGTTIGDRLLLEVELRLGSILRDSDLISWVGTDTPGHKLLPTGRKTQYRATIARLGGDEFGLLLPSAQTEEQANTVARRIVETLNKPFTINNNNINIECKIGISIYPIHGDDEKVLIRNADKAMYQAKSLNLPFYIFNPESKNGTHQGNPE